MSEKNLFSDEYYIEYIGRRMKLYIQDQSFYFKERYPTREEYIEKFNDWKSKLKCEVTNYDLGIYNEEELGIKYEKDKK